MNNLSFKVTGNRLELIKDAYSTQSCVNYDLCTFSFDDEWEDLAKTAVFGFGNSDVIRVSMDSNSCKIPAVCMKKEGYVRIGVYGIADDETVIATNCVAHRIEEGIDELDDWFEEDSCFVFNALAEVEASLDRYKASLDKRFDSLVGNLGDGSASSGEPSDWYLPNLFTGMSDVPSRSKNSTYDDYLNFTLNQLAADFPEYVSSTVIGTDESGEYPIYIYSFEPKAYEKTVFVSSSLDGNESSSLIALSAFLDDLCRNYLENRTLEYLHSRVKLVVLPVGNPHGLMSGRQLNSNNVRINRNFNFKWSECAETNKGTAPADQDETRAIQNLLQTLSEDKLCAVVNFREFSNLFSGKMIYYPRFRDNCLDAITKTLYRYNFEEKNESDLLSNTLFAPTLNPTMVNYAAENFGVNACTVVWPSIAYGGFQNAEAVTKFIELIGNMIYTLAKNSTFTLRGGKLPFTKYFSWRSTGDSDVFVIPESQSLKKAPITSYQLVLYAPCNVTLNGYAIIKAENACRVRLNPLLWQDNSTEQSYSDRLNMSDFIIDIPLNAGTHVIPFDSVLQGYYSDNNGLISSGCPEKLCFSLALCADTASAAKLVGFSTTLNAFASDLGRSVEISHPMGTADNYTSNNDVPTQVLVYPIQSLSSSENNHND